MVCLVKNLKDISLTFLLLDKLDFILFFFLKCSFKLFSINKSFIFQRNFKQALSVHFHAKYIQ